MRVSNLIAALTLAGNSQVAKAQNITTVDYLEKDNGVIYSFAIPNKTVAPFDIYLSITAPIIVTWVGLAIGSKMIGDPLIVVWPTNDSFMASPRWAS